MPAEFVCVASIERYDRMSGKGCGAKMVERLFDHRDMAAEYYGRMEDARQMTINYEV